MFAEDHALICLSLDNEIIGVSESIDGLATLHTQKILPGEQLLLTATLQNHFRYMQYVESVPPEGQYFLIDSLVIVDSVGNSNNIAEYGETIQFAFRITNVGNSSSNNLNLELSCFDDYGALNDSVVILDNLNPNESAWITNSFEIQLSPATPDKHQMDVRFSILDDEFSWDQECSIEVHSPKVKLISLKLMMLLQITIIC